MSDSIVIDRKNPLPVYHQIKEHFKNKIKQGELKPLDCLPSEPKMSQICQVSPMTVRHAYTELESEGLIFREHGKGTFVAVLGGKGSERKRHVMTKSLGLIIPNIIEDVYPKIARGVEDATHNKDYSLIICNTDNDVEKQVEYLHRMAKQRVSGLIILPIIHESVAIEHYLQLQRDNIPFVFINRFIAGLETDYVISDNVLGAYCAVKHLIELGHRKIAYISDPGYVVAEQRLEGYKKALTENDISFDESLVRFAKLGEERPGHRYMKEFVESGNLPTALFAFNDRVAKEAYEALVETGLRVPDDVAIVGYDDSPIAVSLPVPLTTVAYPSYDTGKLAADIILSKMESNNKTIQQHVLSPELVVRKSCGAER